MKKLKGLSASDYLLIILFILALVSICNAEVSVSIIHAPGDRLKSLVECSYPDKKLPDDRLLVLNSQLESEAVVTWFQTVCLQRDKE